MYGLVKAIGWGLVRGALIGAGGFVVAAGWLTAQQEHTVEGSVLALIGVGFTVYDKFVVHGKIADAAASGVVK